jgi:hypothetical protein
MWLARLVHEWEANVDSWPYWAFGAAMLALFWILARSAANASRQRLRQQLGLPTKSPVTPREWAALMAFKNTDATLRNTFPRMSEAQRQALAQEVLRDSGVLPMANADGEDTAGT